MIKPRPVAILEEDFYDQEDLEQLGIESLNCCKEWEKCYNMEQGEFNFVDQEVDDDLKGVNRED